MGRRLGQHFLTDPAILDRIVDAIDPRPDDVVIEVGAGKGTLTARLAPKVRTVIALERDVRLAQDCGLRVADCGLGPTQSLQVVSEDALTVDWHDLIHQSAIRHPPSVMGFKVVGNIPYYITSPLIEKALTPPLPVVVVFLVQREVADRLAARPGSKTYGALSVGVQVVASVERLFVVRAGSFRPPPKVDSAVVRLTPLERPLVPPGEHSIFRAFLAALFGQRRKQIGRSLRSIAGMSKEGAEGLLAQIGVEPTARPEDMSPEQHVAVFQSLHGGTLYRAAAVWRK